MTLPLFLLPSRLKKYQKIANPDQILRGDNLLQWSSILFGWGGGGGERESFPALMNFLALENQILFLYTLSILGLKEKIY